MSAAPLVLDASVGVKWVREEPGSDEALSLLAQHGRGEVRLVVPAIFVYEVLDVVRRTHGLESAVGLWDRLGHDDLVVVGPGGEMMRETLTMAQHLGCSVHDAAAPALAVHLGVTLVSADRRAHSRHVDVRLLG